jgi:tetratricopeptide (TPR) repeat protein
MKKNKCTLCLQVKGKRLCTLRDKTFICPRCCAEIRNTDCEGCSHYAQAEQYSLEKLKKSQDKKFIVRIDEEVDNEVHKALTYAEQGELALGETILNTLREKHSDLYVVHYGMGTLQAIKGNYADAIIHFDKCLEIFPFFVDAWFNRGVSHNNLLNICEALKSYHKVVAFGDPQDDFVKEAKEFLETMAESILEDTGLSLEEYLESHDTFNKAFAFMKKSEYAKAIIEFNKVLRLTKNHVQANGNLGICHAFLGQREKALAFFDQALEIDPTYEPAISNRDIVRSLREGEKLPNVPFETIEYYKDVIEKVDDDNNRQKPKPDRQPGFFSRLFQRR